MATSDDGDAHGGVAADGMLWVGWSCQRTQLVSNLRLCLPCYIQFCVVDRRTNQQRRRQENRKTNESHYRNRHATSRQLQSSNSNSSIRAENFDPELAKVSKVDNLFRVVDVGG